MKPLKIVFGLVALFVAYCYFFSISGFVESITNTPVFKNNSVPLDSAFPIFIVGVAMTLILIVVYKYHYKRGVPETKE